MATKGNLKRGFKANAERLAVEYREKLGLNPCAPLPASKLAEFLKIHIYPATEFLTSNSEIASISGNNGFDCRWSALKMQTEAGNIIIIHNPFHSSGRQQSDIMHELAHIICKHENDLKKYNFTIPSGMRIFNDEQEEEAKCLGSTLQLSSPCLLWAAKNEMQTETIATYFDATVEMVNYRMNITGIAKRAGFRKRA